MRKKLFSLIGILSGLFLWGCYPDGPTYTEDLDIVITHHNPDYDFSTKGTYALPDKIVEITGNIKEGELPQYIPQVNADQILQRIAYNMDRLGWTPVNYDESPDILLLPAAWDTTNIMYYYDYWYWWWGGYYPYYPYYPPVYSYSYTTGSVLMTMRDPNEIGGNGKPIEQWTGVINGVLNDKFNASRVNSLIDQAFEQSSYLQTN
jgi:hypothetical protein